MGVVIVVVVASSYFKAFFFRGEIFLCVVGVGGRLLRAVPTAGTKSFPATTRVTFAVILHPESREATLQRGNTVSERENS